MILKTRQQALTDPPTRPGWFLDDDDVYYYIGERLKLEGETENMGVCTKERKSITAEVLMATRCTGENNVEAGVRIIFH